MKSRKQFAIIGLGRFGISLITELSRMGYDVLAIDNDGAKVDDILEFATHAVQIDSMDKQALKALGITDFDVVVVAIGQNIQASILTAIILKEMGVKKLIVKAQNELHGAVLEKIGTDVVVYPERDMAIRLARALTSHNVVDQINLSSKYSILEIRTPKAFVDKTLVELDVRRKMKVTVVAIKRGDEIIISPNADQVIRANDILVVAGDNDSLRILDELDQR
ncbi:MAG: potassium channel family protein [Syntrophomonadaceae bacterium]